MTQTNFQQQMAQLSPASLRAYKRIVQFMYKAGLESGQALPPQQELRLQMKLTNDALTRAMGVLCKQGVLERKTRLGTRVVDLSKTAPIRWTLGLANIAAPEIGPLSTFTTLAHHIQVTAARQGFSVQTYYRFNQIKHIPVLEEFGELEQHLIDRSIDGLILLTPLDRTQWASLVANDIPLIHGPFWETAPCGIVTDQYALTQQAAMQLAQAYGDAAPCTRFGVVLDNDAPQVHEQHVQALAKGLWQGKPAVDAKRGQPQFFCHGQSLEGGQNVARDLLAMPASERPDGLIVLDDYIALGMTQVLASSVDGQGQKYQPRMAVQTNREVFQSFHLPVIRFEVNLSEMARLLVDGISKRLYNPLIPQSVEFIEPTACVESDSLFAAVGSGNRHVTMPNA